MKLKRRVIIDLLNKKSIKEKDIIFIKNRENISLLILKRQRDQLSTRKEKEKKRSKILTLLSSKKEVEIEKNNRDSDNNSKNKKRLLQQQKQLQSKKDIANLYKVIAKEIIQQSIFNLQSSM